MSSFTNFMDELPAKSHIGVFVSSLDVGGAERVAIILSNGLADLGHSVDLVVMKSDGNLRSLVSSNVKVIDLHSDRGRSTYFKLVKYLRCNNPAVVMSLLTVPNALLGLTKIIPIRNRPKLVGSERSYYCDITARGQKNIFSFLIFSLVARIGYRFLDLNIALTNGIRERMIADKLVSPSKVVVLPNPIDLSLHVFKEKAIRHEVGPIKILSVGRLNSLKDYPTLLRAISLLEKKINVRLKILGVGEELERLQSMCVELDLVDIVEFVGYVSDPTNWYEDADVFVLSSIYEGFPNVIVEALAHGLPIVSTDCPTGPKEILNSDELGLLVPTSDPASLADAILTSVNRKTDPHVLRERAEEYSGPTVCSLYEKILLL